jgi:hypothetical protein
MTFLLFHEQRCEDIENPAYQEIDVHNSTKPGVEPENSESDGRWESGIELK